MQLTNKADKSPLHVQLSAVRCGYPPDGVGRKHRLLDLWLYVEFKTNLKQLFPFFLSQ